MLQFMGWQSVRHDRQLNNNSYDEYLKILLGSSVLQYESFPDLHELAYDHSWNILLDAIRKRWA